MLSFAVSENVLPCVGKHLPFAYVEPSTMQVLRHQQLHHVNVTIHSKPGLNPSAGSEKIKQMILKQEKMLQIMQKDLAHARRLKELRSNQHSDQCIKRLLHSKRLVKAQAQKYFHDYEVQLQSKLNSPRTKEEQTFISTFKKGLQLHNETMRNAKKCAREKCALVEKCVHAQLESLEN